MEGGWKAGARTETGRVSHGSLHPDGRTGVAELRSQTGDEVTVTMEGGLMKRGWRWEMSGDDQLDKKTTYTENTEGGGDFKRTN